MSKYLFAELVNKLIKTEIYFSFHFIIEKLFPEYCQSIHCTVIVQVQRIKNIPVINVNAYTKFAILKIYWKNNISLST